ncbi:MAG: NAD(P)-dependent oxidoreductase [Ferruginibacter sp.]|nr:NAD(P)-dependent oxidoreductase [Ferruginibacter sp.]
MNEKVLITGASGFLGYHIIQAAIEKGLDVYAAVRTNSNIEHLDKLPVHYLYLNYDNREEMTRQLTENKIDYIIHAAGVTKAIRQEVYNLVNATYTLNLAKAAEKLGGNLKKMVFISSLAAVGPLGDYRDKITEQTCPNPVTAYGRSKLLAEKNLANIAIPTTILRPTAIYGPRDRDIFIMVKTLNKGLDPYIGKMLQQLSFVHVKDVAEVAVNSLFMNNARGIYNITDGHSYNRYQFSDIARILLKKNALRFHIPMPLVKMLAYILETTNGWLKKPSVINREKLQELAAKNWICDISKAKKELAFSPQFDLQSGLEDSIAWYVKNKWI